MQKTAVYTEKTPDEIIGPGNLSIFIEHFKLYYSKRFMGDREAKEFDSRLLKKFTPETLARIGAVYSRLHNHGFVPHKVDQYGDIKWSRRMMPIYGTEQRPLTDETVREERATDDEVIERFVIINKLVETLGYTEDKKSAIDKAVQEQREIYGKLKREGRSGTNDFNINRLYRKF